MLGWRGDLSLLLPGRAVLIGFPQDEGVRRNGGRVGAAQAPAEIRRQLQRLTPWDGVSGTDLSPLPPLDAGNLRIAGNLEESQQALGEVVAGVLASGAVPVVLGGGHETAYGCYLGHVLANSPVGIVNIDAHLDVRPCPEGRGNSGTPFRQALEHPTQPLPGQRYVCLGLQPHSTSRQHWEYVRDKGCVVRWQVECYASLARHFAEELERLEKDGCRVHVTVDADAVTAAEVPGVSAPNPLGFDARQVIYCLRLAGRSPIVASVDLVEVNPAVDRDNQSSRWAALAVWHFLIGLAERRRER